MRALVALATLWVLTGRAEARTFVVINGAADAQGAREAVLRLRAVAGRGGLSMSRGELAAALAAPPAGHPDPLPALVEAARRDLVRFDYGAVLRSLREAEAVAIPGQEAVLAELNFLAGVAYAGNQDEARAIESFRLVRRLDPAREALDPAMYQPRLVRLFERAGRDAAGAQAPLRPRLLPAQATLWVDGRAGSRTELTPGDHYVGALAEGHAGRLLRLTAVPGSPAAPELSLRPLSPSEQGAELAGAAATDPARAAGRAAALTGADVVLLVRAEPTGDLQAASFVDGRLGPFRPVAETEAALAARISSRDPARADMSDAMPPEGSRRGADRPGPRRSFWTSGWGITVIAVAVAAAGTSVVLLTMDRGSPSRFEIGPPCFQGTPGCP
jgi:hypothetical protein